MYCKWVARAGTAMYVYVASLLLRLGCDWTHWQCPIAAQSSVFTKTQNSVCIGTTIWLFVLPAKQGEKTARSVSESSIHYTLGTLLTP